MKLQKYELFRRQALASVGLVMLCGACSESMDGPCVVTYEDPLLTIASVSNAQTGAPVSQVRLRDIRFRGNRVNDLQYLTQTSAPARGVTVQGQELVCNVSCAFGADEGVYTFVVSQAGLRDTLVSVDAKYANRRSQPGGCPTTLSGGIALQLRLSPQGAS